MTFDMSRILIRYVGERTCVIPAAHGNSHTDRPFMRTNPSVIEKIKQVVNAADGKAGPAKLYKEYVRTVNNEDPRNCPRDLKQVTKYFFLRFNSCYAVMTCINVDVNLVTISYEGVVCGII